MVEGVRPDKYGNHEATIAMGQTTGGAEHQFSITLSGTTYEISTRHASSHNIPDHELCNKFEADKDGVSRAWTTGLFSGGRVH